MATKAEQACKWMTDRANDDRYGYAWGGWGPFDYDCGHAVITAYEDNGVPLKTKGATYTGNIYEVAMICGFKDVTNQVDRYGGNGCKKGDILLNCSSHAAMYCGNGQLVHARSSEGNSVSGDASGNEWRIQPFYSHPWDYVLRYEADGVTEADTPQITVATPSQTTVANATSNAGKGTAALQGALIYLGFEPGRYKDKRGVQSGVDGDAGAQTNNALKLAIASGKITQDETDQLMSMNS